MSCPNCNTEMSVVNLDNQILLHCGNCGGSFFEENGINRIGQDSAFQLSQDKKSDEVSGQEKKCPKDQTVLSVVENNESIPNNVTLLKCPTCKGIFVYPEDLVAFKKAQDVKVNYFKTWGIPLPSLRAIVVLSFVAFISAAAFSRFLLYQNRSLGQTQARDLIKQVSFFKSGRYGFISFKTSLPFRSFIVITDTKTNQSFSKEISTKPTLLHYVTLTNIPFTDPLTYHIVLVDEKGREVKTEEKLLEIK